MKKINIFAVALLVGAIVMAGCSGSNYATRGGVIGGTSGALLGAGVGALAGGDAKSAAIGAAVGAAVGTGAGVLIGNRMDKQKAELERIAGAQVEEVTDANDLKAIKVTFADGILFATNSSQLNQSSRNALTDFARSLSENPLTDVTIQGHTDNTGSRAVNERLSADRAQSVASFLTGQGIAANRLTTQGLAFDVPVADNATAEGRAKNRRVEVFISANSEMIKQAEAGTLQ